MITLGTLARLILHLQAQVQSVQNQNAQILAKLGAIMSEQSHLDADVAQLSQEESDVVTALSGIQADIAALKDAANSGQPLDFTALDQKVADLQGVVTQAQGIAADNAPAGQGTTSGPPAGQ